MQLKSDFSNFAFWNISLNLLSPVSTLRIEPRFFNSNFEAMSSSLRGLGEGYVHSVPVSLSWPHDIVNTYPQDFRDRSSATTISVHEQKPFRHPMRGNPGQSWILDSTLSILLFVSRTWIPDSLSCIPDSKIPDSWLYKQKFPRFPYFGRLFVPFVWMKPEI